LYVQLAMALTVAIIERGEIGPGFSVGTKKLI
jgi:hypothetical protein